MRKSSFSYLLILFCSASLVHSSVLDAAAESIKESTSRNLIKVVDLVDTIAGRTPTASPEPTSFPTESPAPSPSPSKTPTMVPTITDRPSPEPSAFPTESPAPSPSPTMVPSAAPSASPTASPSESPSASPTSSPSSSPSVSSAPSDRPSTTPSVAPTQYPSASPSASPTEVPSTTPTGAPTSTPSASPTNVPSLTPSHAPTQTPSFAPSVSQMPSTSPTSTPSVSPTGVPSVSPTPAPSVSSSPSMNPTVSAAPSSSPSQRPTEVPSFVPTAIPSIAPTTASSMISNSVTLTLDEIDETMESSDVAVLEEVTKKFISDKLPKQDGVELIIQSVELLNQTVIPSRRSLLSKFIVRRRVLHTAGLRVKLNVTGEVFPGTPPDDFSFEYAVAYGFANNYLDFLGALIKESNFFIPAVVGETNAEGIIRGSQPSNTKKGVSTKATAAIVVGALAALTLAILASVISLKKRSYRNRLPSQWGPLRTPNSSANGYDLEEVELGESQSTAVNNGHIDRYAAEGQPNQLSPVSVESGKARYTNAIEVVTPVGSSAHEHANESEDDPEIMSVEMELSVGSTMLNPASTKSALFDGIIDSVVDDETLDTNENIGVNLPGLQSCCTPQQMPAKSSHPHSNNSITEEYHSGVSRTTQGQSFGASSASQLQQSSHSRSNYLESVPTLHMSNMNTNQPMTPASMATPGSVATASSGHLGARPMEATEEVQYRESSEEEATAGRRVGLYDVFAPSGPLGIVVDTTPDGPIVHSMKPTSTLLGLVNPGDLVVGLDDMDTRAMSAATLTRLMAKRAQMPERKITLLAADN